MESRSILSRCGNAILTSVHLVSLVAGKCPGYLYSYFKVSAFAAILLRQFKLEPVEGQTVTQVQCGFVTEPKEELLVYIGKRK